MHNRIKSSRLCLLAILIAIGFFTTVVTTSARADEPVITIEGTDPPCISEYEAYLTLLAKVEIRGAQTPCTISYRYNGGNWMYTGEIHPSDPDANTTYGTTVSPSLVQYGGTTIDIKVEYKGGTKTISYTLPYPLTITASVEPAPCATTSGKPKITVAASGGTQPYSYSYGNTPSNSNTFTPAGAVDEYITVTVKDKNGCEATQTVFVPHKPSPINFSVDLVEGCDGKCKFFIHGSGGTGTISYSLSPSILKTRGSGTIADPEVYEVDCSEHYTITATDQNGCTKTMPASFAAGSDGSIPSRIREGVYYRQYTSYQLGQPSGQPCTVPVSIQLTNDAPPYLSLSGFTFTFWDKACIDAHNDDESQCPPAATSNPATLSPGSYWVKVAYPNGCYYWVLITIDPCGTRKEDDPPYVTINPNPGSGIFQVGLSHSYDEALRIKLFDNSGNLIVDRDFGEQSAGTFITTLDITNEQSGTYYLQAIVAGTPITPLQMLKQ